MSKLKLSPDTERDVARAMELLGPTARRGDVETAVFFGRRFVRRAKSFKHTGHFGVLTKQQKTATHKFATALHRLQIALKNAPWSAKVGFPLDDEDLTRWRQKARAAADVKLGRPKRTNFAARSAAQEAARLLQKHNLPLAGSRFCRLAAIIYGDEKADMRRYCADVKRLRKPGTK